MLTFLSVAFLVYGTMHLYALSKVWLAFPHSLGLGLTLVLFGLVMTVSPLLLWQISRQNCHSATVAASWVTYLWMGFLFLFCSIALVFDFGQVLAMFVGFKWQPSDAMALLSIGALALVMVGYGFVEARQIRVEEITIATPKLPPAIGRVTIAQISDLHLGVMQGEEFLDRVIFKLRELQPDIIVATGDILDGKGNDLNELAKRFFALKPPKGGTFAIIGNHEFYAGLEDSIRFLRSAGFTVLRGKSAATEGIILVGVDDPSAGELGEEISADTRKALVSAQNGSFIVLLKHQPVVDGDIPFDLQLSGHIHEGQIFPFGFLTRLTYGVHTGLTPLADGRRLYVSRGAGTWGPPIRILAEPEITLIKIEKS